MNYITPEQIKEYVSKNPTGIAGNSKELSEMVNHFAELIVGECVAVVDRMADPEDSERYFWAIQNASQKIREHFGVEE